MAGLIRKQAHSPGAAPETLAHVSRIPLPMGAMLPFLHGREGCEKREGKTARPGHRLHAHRYINGEQKNISTCFISYS